MSANLNWTLALPTCTVLLRSERPDDARFLAALFRSTATPLPGVNGQLADGLVAMQQRSQRQTYRTAYPDAWFAVLEADGAPFGHLVLDQAPVSCIVDYALMPAARGQGLGTAILAAVLQRVAGPVRSTVLLTNAASLAMCRRAGFVVTGQHGVHVGMEWRPAAAV